MKRLFLYLMTLPSVVFGDTLFDLKLGAEWTYQVERGRSFEGSFESNSRFERTNRIDAVKVINDERWYQLIEHGAPFWRSNSAEGQVESLIPLDDEPQSVAPEAMLVYKYPAAVGDQWVNYGTTTHYLGTEKVVVPAGRFKCHVYYLDLGDGNYIKSWIAKGVGIVYEEEVRDNDVMERSSLIAFSRGTE